ncbi:MAG TPA: NADP-dependent oxidoreductase [Solirubrobacteraceae bacterium]|nr:NADP-dependent oxidoreductase [Solirubrobacteraceae bacterium]
MRQARRWVARDFGGPEVLEEIVVELPDPEPGKATVQVRAAGMNPADYKHFGPGQDRRLLPLTIGYEVGGVIAALGPETEIASGGGSVGDEVVVFQVSDGYSSALNAPAADVFAKPPTLTFPQAANLLLVGTTAAETLHVVGISAGETVLVHGAAGAVGTSVVQQAALLGATVIGTAGEADLDAVGGFGATPVTYGPGLEQRVRGATPGRVDAVIDTVGVDEAIDVSLALVADRSRIVSTAAFGRAQRDGFQTVGAANPRSGPFRAAARQSILDLAARGKLTVPIGDTFALSEAPRALEALRGRHPYGKLALVP